MRNPISVPTHAAETFAPKPAARSAGRSAQSAGTGTGSSDVPVGVASSAVRFKEASGVASVAEGTSESCSARMAAASEAMSIPCSAFTCTSSDGCAILSEPACSSMPSIWTASSVSASGVCGWENHNAPPIMAAPAMGPTIQRQEAAAAPPAAPPAMAVCMVAQLGAASPGAFSKVDLRPCSKPPAGFLRLSSFSSLTALSIFDARPPAGCDGPWRNSISTCPRKSRVRPQSPDVRIPRWQRG